MLRVCVIGLGHIGRLHSKIYKENNNVNLVGVCDINSERAKAAGNELNVNYYLSALEMLNELKPDLVSVCTGGFEYSSDHFEPTMQALDFCDVLCEKPISNDIENAKEMVSKAKKLGRRFAVDMNHRFTPAGFTCKKWQDDGKIGTLLFVNMALWIGRPELLESKNYHLKALNPHSIDIMRHFCGDIESVQCFAMTAPGRNIWSTASDRKSTRLNSSH